MCGIFALLNNTIFSNTVIEKSFQKGKNRGPEFSKLVQFLNTLLGFHRLAINGLNETSNQPIIIDNIILICNGEIYNYKQLYKEMSVEPVSNSDCEVIIHLYKRYGIEQTLQMLDGVFAFVLLDNRLNSNEAVNENTQTFTNRLYVARDTYGICPLYYLKSNTIFGLASELKCLSEIYNQLKQSGIQVSLAQMEPSTYSVFTLSSKVNSFWTIEKEKIPFIIPTFSFGNSNSISTSDDFEMYNVSNNIYKNIETHLINAVNKRCMTTERPVACLLSGGLDSSLITALVNNYNKLNGHMIPLETYSIGLEGSEDIKYAKRVATYLETKHTEVIVTEQEMFDAISEVIYSIESYDTTTVRASLGNYLVAKYISKNSDAKVIFNGDGSDELCGGYMYMNYCTDNIEFDKETRRLLSDIYLFDVLRSDRSISSNGLEPRTPFLDRSFVNYYLSIPSFYRFHKNHGKCEKYLLRRCFDPCHFKNYNGNPLLPNDVLWRRKEAFSDGVSSHSRSLFEILQDRIIDTTKADTTNTTKGMSKLEIEKTYYKSIFDKHYPNLQHVLPYYWMPKYTNATDPSARTLEIYKSA